MECRGEKKRIFIVQNYIVKPICNLKLLNGQKIPSDAGGEITDHYYIFEAIHKIYKTKSKIICGSCVAEEFRKLLNLKELPKLFNPLANVNNNKSSPDKMYNKINNTDNNIKWDS